MVMFMLVIGKKVTKKVRVFTLFHLVLNMKDYGRETKSMEPKELLISGMVINTQANGKMGKCMGKVFMSIKTEINMKVTSMRIKRLVKVFSKHCQVKFMKENLKMLLAMALEH